MTTNPATNAEIKHAAQFLPGSVTPAAVVVNPRIAPPIIKSPLGPIEIWGDDGSAKLANLLAAMENDGQVDPLGTIDPFAPLEPTAPLPVDDHTAPPPLPNDPPMPPHQLTDGTNRLQCGHADCRGWLNRRFYERCPNCNRRVMKVKPKAERRDESEGMK